MQWKTAYWIAKVNGWDLNNRADEIRLMKNTHEQIKYAVWYRNWLCKYMEQKGLNKNIKLSVTDIRYAAIDGFNLPSIDPTKNRIRDYFLKVLGGIAYQEYLISKMVDETYDWEEAE